MCLFVRFDFRSLRLGSFFFLKSIRTEFSVTAVDSGTRALQYLGLDGEEKSVGFDVRRMSSEKFVGTPVWLERKRAGNFTFTSSLRFSLQPN